MLQVERVSVNPETGLVTGFAMVLGAAILRFRYIRSNIVLTSAAKKTRL